jgi:hypothetical protein
MNHLVVPHAFPGGGLDADQGISEQVVTGPLSAIEVVHRRPDRQIDVPELLVGA